MRLRRTLLQITYTLHPNINVMQSDATTDLLDWKGTQAFSLLTLVNLRVPTSATAKLPAAPN